MKEEEGEEEEDGEEEATQQHSFEAETVVCLFGHWRRTPWSKLRKRLTVVMRIYDTKGPWQSAASSLETLGVGMNDCH